MHPRHALIRRYAAAGVAAALLVSGCAASGSGRTAPKPDPSYRPPAGAVLADPVSRDDVEDNHVLRVLVADIDNAPRGSLIRIVGLSLSLMPVADALVDAHRRGVRVQIIVARRISKDFKAVALLRGELGTDRTAGSFIRLIRGSARGGPTALHQKTWAFSRTGRARDVVMVGSANLSYTSMGEYNDMYSFVGRRDVWRQFAEIFAQQVRDRPVAHPQVTAHLGRDTAWFYPGFTEATDPVRRYLAAVPTTGLRIRIAMLAWHGPRGVLIARTLADKARAGARIEAVVTTLDRRCAAILAAAGIRVHLTKEAGFVVHHKLMLVRWTDAAGRTQRRIITGSDNFGDPALARDEVEMAIDPTVPGAWAAYQRHYDGILARFRN